jgi:hypothetical protein
MNPLLRTVAAAMGLTVCIAIAVIPAFAHHSVAMFDNSKTVTLKGTVKQFQWVNPHAIIWVEAEGVNGDKPKLWAVELASPGVLTRNGWTKRSFSAGDKVTVDVGPLRDGMPGGFFKKATLLGTGQVLVYSLQPESK